jgi:hypothetical protein
MSTNSLARRRLFGLITTLMSGALAIVAGEVMVRRVAPQGLILLRPDIWVPADGLGWTHAAGVDTRVNAGEREIRWRTDENGFRIGSSEPAGGDLTLVALGDSVLEALQVDYEDTMTALLERRLSGRLNRSVRILNTGVGGWDPNQYRIQLMRLGDRPIDGILVFVYLGNDVVGERVQSYPARPPVARRTLRVPRSFAWKELVAATAYPLNDFLEVRSHLFILFRTRLKYVLMRVGLTAYRFPDTLLRDQSSSDRWKVSADILAEIAQFGQQRNVPTLFVLIPSPAEANPTEASRMADAFGLAAAAIDINQAHRLLGGELKRRNLSTVDATSPLRAAITAGVADVYGQVDTHLGRAGHRIVAEMVEATLSAMAAQKD